MPWHLLVRSIDHFGVQLVHVFTYEGQLQCQHFVKTTSEGPNVRLLRVVFIVPDFRTCVTRSASLRLIHLVFEDFRDVEISKFDRPALVYEDVCSLEISMDDVQIVQRAQSVDHLNQDAPYFDF